VLLDTWGTALVTVNVKDSSPKNSPSVRMNAPVKLFAPDV